MFGRSGQMFPRRAYHDAMYEEEYGSEADEDCCRGRGASGVLCWCFSVILLIGLAASVILTVFFVLKSRNLMGSSSGSGGGLFDDLDLFYGFNQNKFDKNDTVILSHNNSTEVTLPSAEVTEEADVTMSRESHFIEHILPPKVVTSTSTTRPSSATPTRRRILPVTTTTSTSTSLPSTSGTTKATTPETTTTTTTPKSYILGPEDTIMATVNPPSSFPRRISNLATLERPTVSAAGNLRTNERWNPIVPAYPTSSEENLSTTTHAHVLFSMPPSTNQNSGNPNRRRPHRGPPLTSFSTSTEKLKEPEPSSTTAAPTTTTTAPPPPLISTETDSSGAISNPTAPSTNRSNLLERIIKNLAPKFKNKTEVISSNERFVPTNPNIRVKTTIRTRTTTSPASVSSSNEQNNFGGTGAEVIEVIDPPKFNDLPKSDRNSSETVLNSSEFMDLMVGDEDDKRLIIKNTASGIITSAIMPSWYVNDTGSHISSENVTSSGEVSPPNVANVTLVTLPVQVPTTSLSRPGPSEMPSTESQEYPGLGQYFLNMFKSNAQNHLEQPNRVGNLPNSNEPIRASEESLGPTTPNLNIRPTTFKDLLKGLSLPSSSLSPLQPENGFHGFENRDRDYEQDGGERSEESSDDESLEDDEAPSPSHIIEVAFGGKQSPEDSAHEQGFSFSKIREPLNAASDVHPQIIAPPPNFISDPTGVPENVTTMSHNFSQVTISPQREVPSRSTNVTQNYQEHPTVAESSSEENDDTEQNEMSPFNLNQFQTNSVNTEQEPLNSQQNDFYIQRRPVSQLDGNLYYGIQTAPTAVAVAVKTKHNSTRQSSSNERKTFQHHSSEYKTFQAHSSEHKTFQPHSTEHKTFQLPIRNVPEKRPSAITETHAPNSKFPANSSSGFSPPEPIDFHSNVYNFKPSVTTTSGGFTPLVADSWRPVLYQDEKSHAPPPEEQFRFQRPKSPAPVRPSSSPRNNFRPINSPASLLGSILPTFAEALKLRPTTTGSQFDQSAEASSHWAAGNSIHGAKQTALLPSQPIPSPPLQSGRIKFPTAGDLEMSAANQHETMMVDRSKYMHRPVPPPIMMHRNPAQALRQDRRKPFRNPPPPPQYPNQQQQHIQQQRMLRERLHHQQMRQRPLDGHGGGSVHWPHEEPIRRLNG